MIRIDIVGGVKANFEVKEEDIKTWTPERISQFFHGIADAVKAMNEGPSKESHGRAVES